MRKEIISKLESMIRESSTNEEIENELLDKLDELDELFFEIESEIDEQYELKDEYEYEDDSVLADEFNYSNRMC